MATESLEYEIDALSVREGGARAGAEATGDEPVRDARGVGAWAGRGVTEEPV